MGCIISLACTCPSEPRQGTCPRKWGLVVGWKHFPMAQWERQMCVSSIRCCCSSLSPTWSLVLHFGTTNHVCVPEQRRMVRLGLKLQVLIAQHETDFKAPSFIIFQRGSKFHVTACCFSQCLAINATLTFSNIQQSLTWFVQSSLVFCVHYLQRGMADHDGKGTCGCRRYAGTLEAQTAWQ